MNVILNGHHYDISPLIFRLWLIVVIFELVVVVGLVRWWHRRKRPRIVPDTPWPKRDHDA